MLVFQQLVTFLMYAVPEIIYKNTKNAKQQGFGFGALESHK
jgi:hypothetical protein